MTHCISGTPILGVEIDVGLDVTPLADFSLHGLRNGGTTSYCYKAVFHGLRKPSLTAGGEVTPQKRAVGIARTGRRGDVYMHISVDRKT